MGDGAGDGAVHEAADGGVSRRRALAGGALVAVSLVGLALDLAPQAYDTLRLRELEGRRVYDEDADPGVLWAAARARAAREKKRILAVMGGNWCRWCLSLDAVMTEHAGIAAFVAARLVLLKLDGERARDLDAAWGWPTRRGVPVLVFLDPDGTVVHVQDSGALEAFGGRILAHDPGRVLEVLTRWS